VRDFVTLLAFPGVRLSEGLGRRWAVDLDGATITVTAQLDRWMQGQAPKFKGLKTENGYRTIDLQPPLVSCSVSARVPGAHRPRAALRP
jgi:hypothetical protein